MLKNEFAPELQPNSFLTLSSDNKARDAIVEAIQTTVHRIWGDYNAGKPAGYIQMCMATQGPDAVLSKLDEVGVPFEPTSCEGQYQNTYIGSEYDIATKLVVLHGRPKHSKRRSFKVAQKGRVTREYIAPNLALILPFKTGAMHQPEATNHNYFVFWSIFKRLSVNPITGEQEEYDFVRIALILSDGISEDGRRVYCANEWVLDEQPLGPTKERVQTKQVIDLPQAVETPITIEFSS